MRKRERRFVAFRMLTFFMPVAILLLMALSSCSSSSDGDEDWGEDYDPEYMEVCKHVAKVANSISDIFEKCQSLAELSEYEEDIRNMRYVKDVRFSNTTMFVDIAEYGPIMFSYFPEEVSEDYIPDSEMIRRFVATRADDSSHPNLGLESAVLANQQYKDEKRPYCREIMEVTQGILSTCGIKCTPNNAPSIDFFQNEMFDYDIVFIITHGSWDWTSELHWLYTSQNPKEDTSRLAPDEIYYHKDYPNDEVIWGSLKETRNGKETTVWYACISEKFIENSLHEFKKKGKVIFFNSACQSMMGGIIEQPDYNRRNRSLANILKEKGVGIYLGYDESNSIGKYAGMVYFGKLASGMSIRNAYESLPDKFLHNYIFDSNANYYNVEKKKFEHGNREWIADLLPFYSEYNTQIASSRITGPSLEGFIESSNSTRLDVTMQAKSPLYAEILMCYPEETEKYYNYYFKYDKFRYGFEYGTKEDFSNALRTKGMAVGTQGCTLSGHTVSYSHTLTDDQLTPNTTYYYRAYFYDGIDYYYSDSDTFTTKDLPVDTGGKLPDVPGSDF